MRSPALIRHLVAGVIVAVVVLFPLWMPARAAVFDVPTDDDYTVFEDHQLVIDAAGGVFSNDLTSRGPCVAGLDVTGLQGHLPLDSLGPNGQINFSPTVDFNGATSFTYTLGLVNGLGCDSTGNSATVTITVFELNDPPAFLVEAPCSNNITVAEDSGAYDDAAHCVEMLNFGPPDENNQSFDAWLVSSTHPELFAAKPKVTQVDGLFGRLTFTPAANAHGTSTVSIRGRDSGGTADGGDDTSDPETFKITITAVDDPATPGAPTAEPTAEPTVERTPEVTAGDPSVAVATVAPATLTPSGPSPEATPVPGPTAGGGEIPWVPVLLGILLVALVIGFGAALYLPKRRIDRAP